MSRLSELRALSRKPSPSPETGTVPTNTTVPVTGTVPLPRPTLVPLPETSPNHQLRVETGTVPPTTTVPVNTTVPQSREEPVPLSTKARTRIFRATRVEHAHTPGERLILQALWSKAIGNDRERTIRIGYDRLASLAAVNWKTARACLRSLEQKLAIETLEPENSNSREGRLYRIFGFDAILERRKAAGLEIVEKGGRGVELKTGTVPLIGTVPANTAVPDKGTPTVPATGGDTVPATGTPLRSFKENRKEATTTMDVRLIVQTLQAELGRADDDAAKQILIECQGRAPDATVEQIAGIVRREAHRLRGNGRVENPLGLLIRHLPRLFEGEAWRLQRDSQQQGREAPATDDPALARWREEQLAALEDPNVPEAEKELIRKCL